MSDHVLVCITKYELKVAAYSEFNLFDDTDELVIRAPRHRLRPDSQRSRSTPTS